MARTSMERLGTAAQLKEYFPCGPACATNSPLPSLDDLCITTITLNMSAVASSVVAFGAAGYA